MCNRCSNYYYGGNYCNWGTTNNTRSLNRCRNALQNLSAEAANAAELVAIAEAFENSGCGCNSGCNRCHHRCGRCSQRFI